MLSPAYGPHPCAISGGHTTGAPGEGENAALVLQSVDFHV